MQGRRGPGGRGTHRQEQHSQVGGGGGRGGGAGIAGGGDDRLFMLTKMMGRGM